MSPIVSFDPRPLDQCTVSNADVIESFRCDLLSLHEPPEFLDILISSTKKVEMIIHMLVLMVHLLKTILLLQLNFLLWMWKLPMFLSLAN